MKGSCLLMAVVCGVPAGSLGAADLFSDDFDRPDGPLDADPEDDWITPIGTADIVDGEVLLQTAGTEGW
ncbi:MAG: hypothetical protein HY721_14335, partial [Planctomycetes bacterium]|nr:hypothetical protein [Planctomycetota bacterium]